MLVEWLLRGSAPSPVEAASIATILHLLGLNHERLTYFHDGRDFRLTDVSGQIVTGVLA